MPPDAIPGYTPDRGTTPNRTHESLLNKRSQELQSNRKRDIELVFVYDYDPVHQTVDVVPINDRLALPLRGLPIAAAGGHGARYIRPWKGLKSGETKPDVGVVLFPRLGFGRALLDYVRRDSLYRYNQIQDQGLFLGGIPTPSEDQVPNLGIASPAAHQVGANDSALIDSKGAGFILKTNSDGTRYVILRADKVYLLGLDQSITDAQAVARQGDAGDGLGGAIAGGSSRIYAG